MRRKFGRVLVALVALQSLVSVAGAQEDLADRFQDTQDELRDARGELDRISAQAEAAELELTVVDHQLVALGAELAALETQLADRQSVYDDAQSRTQDATRRLVEVGDRLEEVRLALEQRERNFDDRIAATYKYGTVSFLEALLGTEDVSDFVTSTYYVKSVLEYDNRIIEDVSRLTAQIAERRTEVDALRDRLRRDERVAKSARDEVEDLTDAHRRLAAQVASERNRHAELVTQLEAEEAAYAKLISDLEAESEALAAELRRSQWRAGAPGPGGLVWPTDGQLGSGFGWRTHPIFGTRRMHTGVDISGPSGQEIVAAAEGLVVHADWRGGYGLAVVIDHGGGVATLYAHQSALAVREGDIVAQGQRIGSVGSTGWSTGPHLHYEVRVDGEPRDPMEWYS